MTYIDLEFFKGGTQVQEVEKRNPKSEELKAMDARMYDIFGGLANRYGGSALNDALDAADTQSKAASASLAALAETAPQYITEHQNFLANGGNDGFAKYIDNTKQGIENAYARNVGTDLNNLAARGVLNSSVASRALEGQARAAAEAIANNYNNAANMYLSNYISGANAANDAGRAQSDLVTGAYTNALAGVMPAYNYWKDMTNAYFNDDKDYIATSSGK